MTGRNPTSLPAHDERRKSFNAAPDTYHRARPPYPQAVFDLLAERCGLEPGVRVLELGAGNGLATGPLLAAGAQVVAVEPGADLAAILTAAYPGDHLAVVNADFESADLPGTFDLAVAATSLHWLDPVTTIPKLGTLVEPGGWLAAWWNVFGDPDRPTRFRDRLDDVYRDLPAASGNRDARPHALDTDRWTRILTAGGWFHDVAVDVIPWHQTLTALAARDLWSTFPNIAELPEADRERFLKRLSTLIDDEPEGTVEDPRLTIVYTAARALTS